MCGGRGYIRNCRAFLLVLLSGPKIALKMKSVKKKTKLENKKQLSTFPALTHLPLWGPEMIVSAALLFPSKKKTLQLTLEQHRQGRLGSQPSGQSKESTCNHNQPSLSLALHL